MAPPRPCEVPMADDDFVNRRMSEATGGNPSIQSPTAGEVLRRSAGCAPEQIAFPSPSLSIFGAWAQACPLDHARAGQDVMSWINLPRHAYRPESRFRGRQRSWTRETPAVDLDRLRSSCGAYRIAERDGTTNGDCEMYHGGVQGHSIAVHAVRCIILANWGKRSCSALLQLIS